MESHRSLHHKKRFPWARIARWSLLVLAVAFAIPLALGGTIFAVAAKEGYSALERVPDQAMNQEFARAVFSISQAEASLEKASRGLTWLGPWRFVPFARAHIRLAEEGVLAAKLTLSGAKDVVEVAAMAQESFDVIRSQDFGIGGQRSYKDLTPDERRIILGRIANALPQIRSAQEKMRLAAIRWQELPADGVFAPLRNQIRTQVDRFSDLQTQFDRAVQIGEVLLPMTGYPAPKKYVVILQNNQEMRGTGGFIGTVGELWLSAGSIEKMTFQDVYSVDLPISGVWKEPSPAPIARWLEQKTLFLRDANWSPDFPTTAQVLLRYYTEERRLAGIIPTDLNGIIAIQPDFFERLLRITGPVTVEDQTFTADNFFDALQYDVHRGFEEKGIPRAQRKEVVAKLGDAVFQKVSALPAAEWPKLLDLATRSLTQKDILLYEQDPTLQRFLQLRAWAGEIGTSQADYLAVIDSNMGAWKTDGVMDKRVVYQIDAKTPTRGVATVTLRYKNTNRIPDWRYTRYRDYVRVYVPEGSELMQATGAMEDDLARTKGILVPGKVDVYRDLGKTVFGAFFAIEPGQTADLQFVYRLPESVAHAIRENRYELLVQKHPGTRLRLETNLLLPRRLTSAKPSETPDQFGDAHYRVNRVLDQDLLIHLRY